MKKLHQPSVKQGSRQKRFDGKFNAVSVQKQQIQQQKLMNRHNK